MAMKKTFSSGFYLKACVTSLRCHFKIPAVSLFLSSRSENMGCVLCLLSDLECVLFVSFKTHCGFDVSLPFTYRFRNETGFEPEQSQTDGRNDKCFLKKQQNAKTDYLYTHVDQVSSLSLCSECPKQVRQISALNMFACHESSKTNSYNI